jgi:hypothetical protein
MVDPITLAVVQNNLISVANGMQETAFRCAVTPIMYEIRDCAFSLLDAEMGIVAHPIECIDFVTVSDLATWAISKITYTSPKLPSYNESLSKVYGPNSSAATSYICFPIRDDNRTSGSDWLKYQREYFRPVGVLLSGLFPRLAWQFSDMRSLEEYFRRTDLLGRGQGQMRLWDIGIYSKEIRERVYNGILSNGIPYDEWSTGFL